MLLSENIASKLNAQIQHETTNMQKYAAMRSVFENYNLPGFSKLIQSQSDGEYEHRQKIVDYMSAKNANVAYLPIAPQAFPTTGDVIADCRDLIDQVYLVEVGTTKALYEILGAARAEGDYSTEQFLLSDEGLIKEQVEEEELALNLKAEVGRCCTTGDINIMDARLRS